MERGVVVVEENLEVVYECVNINVKGFNGFFPILQCSKGRVEREVFPQDVDDGVRIGCGR